MQSAGFLVISDITGYTAYLTGTEQLHAEEALEQANLVTDRRRRHVELLGGMIEISAPGRCLEGAHGVEWGQSPHVSGPPGRASTGLQAMTRIPPGPGEYHSIDEIFSPMD